MRKIKITNMEDERSHRSVFVREGSTVQEIQPGRELIVDISGVAFVDHQPEVLGQTVVEGGSDDPTPTVAEPPKVYTEEELTAMLNDDLAAMGGEGRTKAELVASILAQQAEQIAKAEAEAKAAEGSSDAST